MSGNVWNRPSGSFMVDMGISSNIIKSPSPKCYMTFWHMTIYSDTLNWSDIILICELITKLDAYSSGHLVLSHFGLAFVLILRPFSPEHVTDFEFRTSLGTSILLTLYYLFIDTIISIFYINEWAGIININTLNCWYQLFYSKFIVKWQLIKSKPIRECFECPFLSCWLSIHHPTIYTWYMATPRERRDLFRDSGHYIFLTAPAR